MPDAHQEQTQRHVPSRLVEPLRCTSELARMLEAVLDREFVVRLGQVLKARGMKKHVEQLRLYWRGTGAWSDDFVNHLGAVLQVPPFERTITVRENAYACCQGATYTSIALDDRTVTTCFHCKAEWLRFHRSVAESIRERAAQNAATY